MPNNLDPPWVGQQRRNVVDEAIWLAVAVALVVWVAKHWYIPAVRFVAGAVCGVVFGLVAIGAAFNGDGSRAALWTTVLASLLMGGVLGGALMRFAGKSAQARHAPGTRGGTSN